MHLGFVITAQPIGKGQAALEAVGRQRATHAGEDLGGVGIGDRQHRDFQDGRRIFALGVLGAGHRAIARRRRIAGERRHIRHRAALHAIGRPAAAIGVGFGGGIAIIGRIGIDQRADSAMFLRQFGFQPAPAAAVTGQRNLALHIDAAPRQRLIIGGQAIVDVHHRRGDIAITLKRHIGRQRILQIARGAVFRNRRFLPAELGGIGAGDLQRGADRGGIKHIEPFDPGIPAPFLELG